MSWQTEKDGDGAASINYVCGYVIKVDERRDGIRFNANNRDSIMATTPISRMSSPASSPGVLFFRALCRFCAGCPAEKTQIKPKGEPLCLLV